MKRVIIKLNTNAPPEVFSSLAKLYLVYPELERKNRKITYWLANKKKPFKCVDFVLYRCVINET